MGLQEEEGEKNERNIGTLFRKISKKTDAY